MFIRQKNRDQAKVSKSLGAIMSLSQQFKHDGYAIIDYVLSESDCGLWCATLERALDDAESEGPLRTELHRDKLYGARNLLSICPSVLKLLEYPRVREALVELLGDSFGAVRGLYFDKPPGVTWSLPWHQDLTIAVAEHIQHASGSSTCNADGFSKPTIKAGVCHVEAPTWLLEKMVTVRIHLDPMGPENGAVVVRPGSHRAGKLISGTTPPSDEIANIHTAIGSVMLMRPLLSHSSVPSIPGTLLHRRVVHIELSPIETLPDGYRWNQFVPVKESSLPH